MTISTRLTERFGLVHPVVCAPMAMVADGRLAASVSAGGGMGMIGGGYGDASWLEDAFASAGNQPVGCGFITWALRKQPQLLDAALAHRPCALFLSFDDPVPFIGRARDAGVPVFCQVQTRRDAAHAIDAGATVIVAQGIDAGGHSDKRGTMSLVPEIADLIATRAPATLLCAAGGIADGRGLAAALMLGADGVVMGSRFWAAREADAHPGLQAVAVTADGDQTLRTTVMDVARDLDWPRRYVARVLRNKFTDQWHGREADLQHNAATERARWRQAFDAGDGTIASVPVGEAVGLIHAVEPAGEILARVSQEAEQALQRGHRLVA
jgi:nitronate monooxygenase